VRPRATWVWDRPAPADLVAWCRAEKVSRVYLGVRADLARSADLAWAKSVVGLADQHAIHVAALGGDPAWVRTSDHALAWQRAVTRTGLFDRVHVDVEVWALDDWRTWPGELGASYLTMLRRLADAATLPLEADLAFHLHHVEVGGEPLDAAAMRVLDAVTVLSYRHRVTGADGLLDVAGPALRAAATTDTPCRLAVETRYLGPSAVDRKQTFHGLGKPALDAALVEVDGLLAEHPTYAGMAVLDHEHWRRLGRGAL
jgi:hypothetical protein